jgi:hypothetical protein
MHPSQQSNQSTGTQPSGTSSSSSSGGYFKFIKDLEPNQKNINLQVIVLDVAKPTQTKDGHEVRSVRIADKTGSINLSVWNEYGAVLKEGDILRLNGCFTQIWKVSLQVKVSTKGQIVKIGEFMMVFSEFPDMSVLPPEILKEIQEQNKQQLANPNPNTTSGPPPIQNLSKQNPPSNNLVK